MIIRVYPDMYVALVFFVCFSALIFKKYWAIRFFADAYNKAMKDGNIMVLTLKKNRFIGFDVGRDKGEYVVTKKRDLIQSFDDLDDLPANFSLDTKEKTKTKTKAQAEPGPTNVPANTETDKHTPKSMVFWIGKAPALFQPEGNITAYNPFKNKVASLSQNTMAMILDLADARKELRNKVLNPPKKFEIPLSYLLLVPVIIGIGLALYFGLPIIMSMLGNLGG